jgi:uncharacterized protein
MTDAALPWHPVRGGLALSLRVSPKAGRDAIEGIEQLADGRRVVKARVRAVPAEGEANRALIGLLAGALEVAPRRVHIEAGATARIKRVMIEGDGAALAAALKLLTGDSAKA